MRTPPPPGGFSPGIASPGKPFTLKTPDPADPALAGSPSDAKYSPLPSFTATSAGMPDVPDLQGSNDQHSYWPDTTFKTVPQHTPSNAAWDTMGTHADLDQMFDEVDNYLRRDRLNDGEQQHLQDLLAQQDAQIDSLFDDFVQQKANAKRPAQEDSDSDSDNPFQRSLKRPRTDVAGTKIANTASSTASSTAVSTATPSQHQHRPLANAIPPQAAFVVQRNVAVLDTFRELRDRYGALKVCTAFAITQNGLRTRLGLTTGRGRIKEATIDDVKAGLLSLQKARHPGSSPTALVREFKEQPGDDDEIRKGVAAAARRAELLAQQPPSEEQLTLLALNTVRTWPLLTDRVNDYLIAKFLDGPLSTASAYLRRLLGVERDVPPTPPHMVAQIAGPAVRLAAAVKGSPGVTDAEKDEWRARSQALKTHLQQKP